MKARIAVLPGDGIGPEVIAQASACLQAVAQRCGHAFTLDRATPSAGPPSMPTPTRCPRRRSAPAAAPMRSCWGRSAARSGRAPMPACGPSRACCACAASSAPSRTCAPWRVHPALRGCLDAQARGASRASIWCSCASSPAAFTSGRRRRDARSASDLCTYTVAEIERIVRVAAQLARTRRRKLTSIDKSNVLETSRLWRAVVAARRGRGVPRHRAWSTCWSTPRRCT